MDADREGIRIPQYGLDRDYPVLNEMADNADRFERIGLPVDDLHREIAAALHELWMARKYVREASRGR